MAFLRAVIRLYTDAFSGLSREIWLLSLVMIINRSGAMVIPFMTLYLTTSLGYSLTEAGFVMGAYGIGSILGAYIGGQLSDRYGHYYVQLYSLLAGALFLLLLLFLTSLIPIMLTVFCFSTVSDTMRPANSVATAVYSTPENRTRSFSLMRFAVNIGFSVGPALGGLVAATVGFRWIFLIDAMTCLVAAWLVGSYLSHHKPGTESAINERSGGEVTAGLSAYRNPTYLFFIVLVAVYAIAFFQLFTSVPVFLKREWGFSESSIGLLMALNGSIIVLFEMPFMRYMENVRQHMVVIAVGCVFLGLGFAALLPSWGGLGMSVLFIILMSVSEMCAMPFMTNYAISVPGEDRRGQYMALYAIAYGIAHIVAPVGSLSLADQFGFITVFWLLIALGLLLAILFAGMQKYGYK